jgi:dTMP kinase
MPGVLITFEGVEGSGKTTQVRLLERSLRAAGRRVLVCREPGGTEIGEALRRALLEPRDPPPTVLTELLILEASRAELTARRIRPALERGEVVLCDRYADASLAYQWGARGLERATVEELNRLATGGIRPARTILLDLAPERGLARLGARRDRMEGEDLAFHRKVREAYLLLAREEPDRFLVLDAGAEAGELAARIREALRPLLGPLPPPDGA